MSHSTPGRKAAWRRARSSKPATGRFIGPGGQEPFAGLGGHMLVYRYYDGKDLGLPKLKVPPIR
jgi:hypothetical protein